MAITTTYNGIEYRSRLEARWAAFMQNIGWDIVYEPFDGDGYIPDFLVQGERPFLVEVKPAVTSREYEAAVSKAERGLADHWSHDILIVGASPFMNPPRRMGKNGGTEQRRNPDAGWMGENVAWAYSDEINAVTSPWSWDRGQWLTCGVCRRIGVFHSLHSWGGRPCWCRDSGNGHMLAAPLDVMESMWADACNDVKWRGKTA